jgi:hypothetical protein
MVLFSKSLLVVATITINTEDQRPRICPCSEHLFVRVCKFDAHESSLARIVPAPSDVALPRANKLKTFVRLTSHNILGNRESIANSRPFAQRIGRRPTNAFPAARQPARFRRWTPQRKVDFVVLCGNRPRAVASPGAQVQPRLSGE